MNKYEEALETISSQSTDIDVDGYTSVYDLCRDEVHLLQELIDKHKPSKHYTKQDLIDELDKVYSIAKQYDDNLIHYADIYRLIERLVEDE